jgi:hypothetical protein
MRIWRIERIGRIVPRGGTAPNTRAVISCCFGREISVALEASGAAVTKKSRPGERALHATRAIRVIRQIRLIRMKLPSLWPARAAVPEGRRELNPSAVPRKCRAIPAQAAISSERVVRGEAKSAAPLSYRDRPTQPARRAALIRLGARESRLHATDRLSAPLARTQP